MQYHVLGVTATLAAKPDAVLEEDNEGIQEWGSILAECSG